MSTITKQRGFTLLETLVYAGGLVLLLVAMLTLLAATYDWYRTATVGSHVDSVGITVSDHIVKSIRSGQSVNAAGTAFGTTLGSLSLSAQANSVQLTKQYTISNGRLTYQENSGTIQYLTPSDVTISRFYLTNISTPISTAIHFDIDITFNLKGVNQTRTYSGAAIMRNSY
ncbi:MAG TPA: hypothetical protein VL335_01510 [Candidatus Paceibacterota bacterium]|jgi:Tfp pilus assembly protein PilV|nr:hypothetical protein [Candidatus Paceibacterota bacterium]